VTGPRSTSRSISEPDGLVVGVIKTPHGVRGEVRVDPRTDVPDRFRVGASLECDGLGALTIRSIRGTPQEPIVGFEGYASRPDAEPLRGRFLRVAVEEARQATKGSYLWADLVGLRAETPAGEPIGDVRRGAVVVGEDNRHRGGLQPDDRVPFGLVHRLILP
jgi:16S rRNA processing protein RimM